MLNRIINWKNPHEIVTLPIAQDWAINFKSKVIFARGEHDVVTEATRATIEVIGRRLRTLGWELRHSSKARWDNRSDSRYYISPRNTRYHIRISNHLYPRELYTGAADYVIDKKVLVQYNILGIIQLIERDEKLHQFVGGCSTLGVV